MRHIEFSVVNMKDKVGNTVFRLISHTQLGDPGSFGRAKLAFPLSFDASKGQLIVYKQVPLALKIIRYELMNQPEALVPSKTALEVMQEKYPTTYAYMQRDTASEKSRCYPAAPNSAPGAIV